GAALGPAEQTTNAILKKTTGQPTTHTFRTLTAVRHITALVTVRPVAVSSAIRDVRTVRTLRAVRAGRTVTVVRAARTARTVRPIRPIRTTEQTTKAILKKTIGQPSKQTIRVSRSRLVHIFNSAAGLVRPLCAVIAIRIVSAVRTIRLIRTVSAVRTITALGAIGTISAIRDVRTVTAVTAVSAIGAIGAIGTIRAGGIVFGNLLDRAALIGAGAGFGIVGTATGRSSVRDRL